MGIRARVLCMTGLGTAALLSFGCAAGNVAYNQGRKAELRKDWDTAVVDYDKAVHSQPDNTLFRLHERQARTHAALFHTEQGKQLLSEGKTAEATGEFEKAASIDPSNEAAKQYLDRLLAQEAAAKTERAEKLEKAIHASEQQAQAGEVHLQPLPQTPLKQLRIGPTDTRRVYETLAKLANLNVGFSYDFQPRAMTLDLSNVTVMDALNMAALESKTFWKVVTPNTILVLPDNPANRRDYETRIIQAVYLTNPLSTTNLGAITTALTRLLAMQYVLDNPDANAILLYDTPEKVRAAEQLIHDLDRSKAEVLIDVTVLEADADRVRDLGLQQVPTSPLSGSNIAGLAFTATTTTMEIVNGASASVTVPGLPLNRLPKISTRDFALVVPGAVANALLTDSRTRILQNPQVRVTDGEDAKLKIGSRVPFATGSFLPSFGGSVTGTSTTPGLGLLASTQFQFQDVGVNLDLTPHLMPNGEIEIKSKIDISSVGQTFNIGGVNEPSFGERSIEHDIRLKEGEVSLLGGLIQSTDATTTTGLPGLDQIPGLKYFFSSTHHERADTEVLIMLTPYVIRLPGPAVEAESSIAAASGPQAAPGPVVLPRGPLPQGFRFPPHP